MTSPAGAETPDRAAPITLWWVAGATGIAGALVLFGVGSWRGHETGMGVVAAPMLLVATLPMMHRARRIEARFDLAGIVLCALAAKLIAAFFRFQMVTNIYGGRGDSTTYDFYGKMFAPSFRRLDFNVDPGLPIPGTGFLRVLTGLVYAVFGANFFVGYLVFGFMALVGCWFFYRAFALALPDGDHQRYALLIFFWPTLTFWPAAIGKEAWMILALGITSYGAASVFRRRPHGFVSLAIGITAAAMPRPHIAIVVVAAMAIGLVMGSLFASRDPAYSAGFLTKAFAGLLLMVAGSLLAPKVATFLNIDDVGGSGFNETLDEVVRRTSQGGSNFDPATIDTPLDYPWALVTVLLRPFPQEANNAVALVSAAEGILLLGLLALSIRQMIRLPATLVKNAYVAYAAAFSFMFVYVFAFIANFGILTRQRSQLLPFVFVIVALPLAAKPRPRAEPMTDDELARMLPRYEPTSVLAAPRSRR